MSLDRTFGQLKSRFRRLGQTLSRELRLRNEFVVQFESTDSRHGRIIWNLKRGEHTEDAESDRGRDVVICLAFSGGETGLWFGMSEEWRRSGKEKMSFSESRLRFYVTQGIGARPDQGTVLRLEWKDRDLTQSGKLAFPGSGAAHPHWQFDDPTEQIAESIATELMPPVETEKETIDLTEELLSEEPVEPVEARSPPGEVPVTLPATRYQWFHKIHFAARAEWANHECDLDDEEQPQHAHSPIEIDEIDRWIISPLRYVRHEFNKYAI